MRPLLFFPLSAGAVLLLAGCPAALSSLSRESPAPLAAAETAAADPRPQLPYTLSAVNRGAFIEFTVANHGQSELPVRPQEFAMLVSRTREQIHYDPHKVVIDLPPDCRVAPGQSVTGRIRFLDHGQTAGNRLVFNPGSDPKGRFAVVTTIRPAGAAAGAAHPAPQGTSAAQ